ncbi:unnamed protein product [Nippostrongylus brasiliensis]|uniref:BZIP domain-containing protein n=1 Tax=Nippostrongylus brasiliensis TaxID=27835 RepID=A0A0N4Y9A6_NIPBR|nr:unnamed protein product [Nippostrongylus brasiliensis]
MVVVLVVQLKLAGGSGEIEVRIDGPCDDDTIQSRALTEPASFTSRLCGAVQLQETRQELRGNTRRTRRFRNEVVEEVKEQERLRGRK